MNQSKQKIPQQYGDEAQSWTDKCHKNCVARKPSRQSFTIAEDRAKAAERDARISFHSSTPSRSPPSSALKKASKKFRAVTSHRTSLLMLRNLSWTLWSWTKVWIWGYENQRFGTKEIPSNDKNGNPRVSNIVNRLRHDVDPSLHVHDNHSKNSTHIVHSCWTASTWLHDSPVGFQLAEVKELLFSWEKKHTESNDFTWLYLYAVWS